MRSRTYQAAVDVLYVVAIGFGVWAWLHETNEVEAIEQRLEALERHHR